MTRKHFKMLANSIQFSKLANPTPASERQRKIIANNIAEALQKENSRFDYSTFMVACGFEEE